nr:hypothetical protein [Nanoarchaeota archaeon]
MNWQDKKKKIFKFIKKQSKKENWFLLSNHKLKERFSDNEYGLKKIEQILEELKKDKEIIVSNLAFDVFIPKEHKKTVLNKLKNFLATPKSTFYFIGLIVMIILFSFPGFVGLFFHDKEATDISGFLFGGFFIGMIIIIVVAWLIQFFYDLLFKTVSPKFKEYKNVIVPCTIISFILLVIVGLYCLITSSPLTPTLLLEIMGFGILGGIAYYAVPKIIKKRKKKK